MCVCVCSLSAVSMWCFSLCVVSVHLHPRCMDLSLRFWFLLFSLFLGFVFTSFPLFMAHVGYWQSVRASSTSLFLLSPALDIYNAYDAGPGVKS